MATDTDNRFRRALREEEEEKRDVRRRSREFDPRESTRRAARAGFREFERDLSENLERLRGRQVGMGRLDTGFAQQDEDRLVRAGIEDLNRELASNALQESSLQLRNLEGRRRGNRYLDMLTGERERERQDERDLFESGGTLLGTAAGMIF